MLGSGLYEMQPSHHRAVKDIQDSCTEQLHLSSQAGLKVPLSPSSGSEARASSLPTVEDATAAIPQPVSGKDSMEVDDKLSMESNEVSNEGDASTERTTVTQSVADEVCCFSP